MILFDLDGTLADCEHRRHFVDPSKNKDYSYGCYYPLTGNNLIENWGWFNKQDPPKKFHPDWTAFYEACDQDKSIEGDNDIEIWSGRCESVRNKTIKWLYENIPYSGQKLIMRPIGDNTPDDQLKERWLDESIASGKKIEYVFDDRPKVIRMWRRRGIFVFNCCQNDEEF